MARAWPAVWIRDVLLDVVLCHFCHASVLRFCLRIGMLVSFAYSDIVFSGFFSWTIFHETTNYRIVSYYYLKSVVAMDEIPEKLSLIVWLKFSLKCGRSG